MSDWLDVVDPAGCLHPPPAKQPALIDNTHTRIEHDDIPRRSLSKTPPDAP